MSQLAKGIDGRIFFGGEYLSAHHAWVLGAISSACYAMRNIVGKETFNQFLFPEADADKLGGVPLELEHFDLKQK